MCMQTDCVQSFSPPVVWWSIEHKEREETFQPEKRSLRSRSWFCFVSSFFLSSWETLVAIKLLLASVSPSVRPPFLLPFSSHRSSVLFCCPPPSSAFINLETKLLKKEKERAPGSDLYVVKQLARTVSHFKTKAFSLQKKYTRLLVSTIAAHPCQLLLSGLRSHFSSWDKRALVKLAWKVIKTDPEWVSQDSFPSSFRLLPDEVHLRQQQLGKRTQQASASCLTAVVQYLTSRYYY